MWTQSDSDRIIFGLFHFGLYTSKANPIQIRLFSDYFIFIFTRTKVNRFKVDSFRIIFGLFLLRFFSFAIAVCCMVFFMFSSFDLMISLFFNVCHGVGCLFQCFIMFWHVQACVSYKFLFLVDVLTCFHKKMMCS